MAERVRALGWQEVEIINSDLGSSAGLAAAQREGFERVLSSVALGEVGIVGSREVSRLSRKRLVSAVGGMPDLEVEVAPRRVTAPPIGRPIAHHRTRYDPARAVSTAASFALSAFTQNRQADHEPKYVDTMIITAVVPAYLDHATTNPCSPATRLCPIVPQSPASHRAIPLDHRAGRSTCPRPFALVGNHGA
jgi:hypothetical protein